MPNATASPTKPRPAMAFPPGALLRAVDICRNPNRGYAGILPIRASTWYEWIKDGKAPPGRTLPGGTVVWKLEDVLALADGESVQEGDNPEFTGARQGVRVQRRVRPATTPTRSPP